MRNPFKKNVARQSGNRHSSKQSSSCNFGLEALEGRRLMSVALQGSTLVLDGAGTNDSAWVSPINSNGRSYYRVFGTVAGASVDQYFESNRVSAIAFYGRGGNDNFSHSTSLNCWMYGGDGADRLTGGFGQDVIYGEGGDDQISDQSTRATANWDNYLFGGDGNDWILGSWGNDQISGGADNDSLYGSDGIDYLWGEDGSDLLEGGNGNDALWGGNGNDRLSGQQGDDWLAGNAGSDVVYGSAGRDHFDYDTTDSTRDFSTSDGDQWWQ